MWRERALRQPEIVCQAGFGGRNYDSRCRTLTYFPTCQGFQRVIFKKKKLTVLFQVTLVKKVMFTLLISWYHLKQNVRQAPQVLRDVRQARKARLTPWGKKT